jgi:hypothetical protein
MPYTVTHRDGGMDDGDGDGLDLGPLLAELDGDADEEHPDVAIRDDDTGWALSAFAGGLVVLENYDLPEGSPRHVRTTSRSDMHELFAMVARGDIDSLLQRDWSPGYGS